MRPQDEAESNNNTKLNHLAKFSDKILKHDYMKAFMEKVDEGKDHEKKFYCKYCEKNYYVNGRITHIKSEKHKLNTPEDEQNKLQELITFLEQTKTNKMEIDQKSGQESIKRDYLEFLGWMMAEKFSFS